MSDINKLVAAVLTAGRMPTLSHRDADSWLEEFDMWVQALERRHNSKNAAPRPALDDKEPATD